MNKITQRHIEVYADWVGLSEPTLMGVLLATPARGKEVFSFEYQPDWLRRQDARVLDPSLQLFHGAQYPPRDQENFSMFLDSSPDRWGRFLMNRREALMARIDGRKERKLLESDYLLGVYDGHRIGGLRFRTNPKSPFLDNNQAIASPPWASLRELEQASLAIEKPGNENNTDYLKWLKMLIAPGRSLGGARPKASVVDEKNHLWIAKFSSSNDEQDVGAWEMVAYKLARRAQITMAEAKLCKFGRRHHTFLSKRFDKTASDQRIHFASAMTLLGHTDGDNAKNGASYLELVQFIQQHGATPTQDLEQLWRRIVFSICVSNVDDHLRNHGFLLTKTGWVLSPAFDINPVAHGEGLTLNISETDNSQNLELVKEVAEDFYVTSGRAIDIIAEVVTAVRHWQKEAKTIGLSMHEQNLMAKAFRVADEY